jgi:hypothetical protein
MNVANAEYMIDEWIIVMISFVFSITVTLPHMLKTNVAIFMLGTIYYMAKMYNQYGILTVDLILSTIVGTIQYIYVCFLIYHQFRSLYTVINTNEKLVAEMKRLLEIFPESVFIYRKGSQKSDEITWLNKHFEQNICNLENGISELQKIAAKVNSSDESNDQSNKSEIIKNLHDLIRSQQEQVEKDSILEIGNVKINSLGINSKPDLKIKKTKKFRDFSIKTLKICWDGEKDVYMHVFIDNTNVTQLIEAKNDIKLQKIMFTSASHEFRTPLNAILNSYDFIHDTLANLFTNLNSNF